MSVIEKLALGIYPRLRLVLQTEVAECGLACLCMIAQYYGHGGELAALRKRHAVSSQGTTLTALMEIAQDLNLATRAVRLELEDLPKLRMPCILHWQFSHFVVLKRVVGSRATVLDPAIGERRVGLRETSDCFTGVALELWPGPEFERHASPRSPKLRHLIGRITGLLPALAEVLLLALALEVFAVASPLFLQWVIDHALVTADRDLLTTLALGFALLVVARHAIAAVRSWILMHFGALLNTQWQGNTFHHLLRLPLEYFQKRHVADIVSRFRSIDVIQRTLTTSFVAALIDGIMATVLAVVLFCYNPSLSLLVLAGVGLYALARALCYRPLQRATREQIVHAAAQETFFLETVRGAGTIKLFGRQRQRAAAWLTLLVRQINARLRTEKLHILFELSNGVLFGLVNVLVVWVGASLVLDGRFTVGMLIAFMAYAGQLSARLGTLFDELFELRMLRIEGERVADIVMTEPQVSEENAAPRLALGDERLATAEIRVSGLRFRYSAQGPDVLRGVDLHVLAGECVAVIGPSGCGKTTLLHLLLGMLTPTAGEIGIAGLPLERCTGARRLIASVTQRDTLFAGSLADNISFFDDCADQQWIEHCAHLAAIDDEIRAMPMAYNTLVGYEGTALSGGQQQRVLLARALYQRPSILLLDEATSHLDLVREERVIAAIGDLQVTRVIVAHRPQTAATADRIVLLENGRIVQERRGAVRAQ